MTIEAFQQSIENKRMPDGLSIALQALWYDAIGDWDQAHDLCQLPEAAMGDRIHAYLHRKEGDLMNAGYWYSRSGAEMHDITLESEWIALVNALI